MARGKIDLMSAMMGGKSESEQVEPYLPAALEELQRQMTGG